MHWLSWSLLLGALLLIPADLTSTFLPPDAFKTPEDSERFLSKMKRLHELQADTLGIKIDWDSEIFKDGKVNPYLFEGRALLTEEQLDEMLNDLDASGRRKKRSITNNPALRWGEQIPVRIDPQVNATPIIEAAYFWGENTCVRLIDRPDLGASTPGLFFTPSTTGCISQTIGKPSQRANITLDPTCADYLTLTQMIATALGVFSEHNRADRNEYVTITDQSVELHYLILAYFKQQWRNINDFVIDYDYGSVMHYGSYQWSYNGTRVLTTTDPNYQRTIGQVDGPTFADVKRVNRAYCATKCDSFPDDCKNGGYPDPLDCVQCKCPPPFAGQLCGGVNNGTGNCGTRSLNADDTLRTLTQNGTKTCYYVITAPATKQVHFELTTLNINSSPGPEAMREACLYHYLEINYRADFSFGGPRFCNNTLPTVSRSQTNKLVLSYKGKNQSRFVLKYKAV